MRKGLLGASRAAHGLQREMTAGCCLKCFENEHGSMAEERCSSWRSRMAFLCLAQFHIWTQSRPPWHAAEPTQLPYVLSSSPARLLRLSAAGETCQQPCDFG